MRKQYFTDIQIELGNDFFPSEEWDILSLSKRIIISSFSSGSYDRAIFTIVIKRKTEYFALTVIIPCLLIGAIELVTFLVPYDETVRLDLSFTCLLAYTMFQIMVTVELPQSAEKPPLLLLLISLFMVYIVIAIVIQSTCIYLADLGKKQHPRKPSHVLQRFVMKVANFGIVNIKPPPPGSLGVEEKQANYVSQFYKSRFSPLEIESTSLGNELEIDFGSVDWIFIAMVLDKVGFLFFIFLIVGTAIALLVMIPAANNWGL